MLEWQKRCKREDTEIAERRSWYTKCKSFKVEESNIRYGRGKDANGQALGYPIIYRAMAKRELGGWYIISEHRKRTAAIKAVEYFAEHGRPMPKRTKATKAKKRQSDKRKAKKQKKAGL
ncbi:MAG: hypothetical protein ACYSWO_29365 [Planctomycetota bacterium]|jgi:hypothetical protein